MIRIFPLLMALGTSVIAGCITINIYFPAAAAEKAADSIIDEVWPLKQSRENTPSHESPQPVPEVRP